MPLQATSGAATYDAFGGGAAVVPNYIEEVFSTWLYTGTSSTLTITNGLNLSGNGGLVWIKSRSNSSGNFLDDTVRGANKTLVTNSDSAQASGISTVTAFNSTGFNVGTFGGVNTSGENYASWAFREQPKFFDIATWTGNGGIQTISHNLGSTPGCIIIKAVTSSGGNTAWAVWHRSIPGGYGLLLNATTSSSAIGEIFATSVTSSSFVVNTADTSRTNYNGTTYIAYIFAHNAGGFGLTGTDNVISCGSTDGSKVTLGYEPQWILYRSYDFSDDWQIVDNMRGLPVGAVARKLEPNTPDPEDNTSNSITIAADGFTLGAITGTAIYIAIRRGPMKVPTSGTSVFAPITATASTGTSRAIGFTADMTIASFRASAGVGNINDRLRGYVNTNASAKDLNTWGTFAEGTSTPNVYNVWNTTALDGGYFNGGSTVWWHFGRAPSVFDEVCYTGTGSNITLPHNLQTAPQLMIFKERNGSTEGWYTFFNLGVSNFRQLYLNRTDSDFPTINYNAYYLTAASTSTSVFLKADSGFGLSVSARTYVAYLFATCAGVSKVGSYTGTGSTLTIDCGFTGGARFVMIKQYGNSAPNSGWYVWDTARGMVAGTDPSLQFNSNAAESNANWVYTVTTGFQIVTSNSDVNSSGGTYIFLAMA